jgi:hypothetical protein
MVWRYRIFSRLHVLLIAVANPLARAPSIAVARNNPQAFRDAPARSFDANPCGKNLFPFAARAIAARASVIKSLKRWGDTIRRLSRSQRLIPDAQRLRVSPVCQNRHVHHRRNVAA